MGNPASSLGIFDIGQLGSAMLRNVTNWIAGEELDADVDPYDVQDKYNRQRDGVRGSANDIGFQGAFRPQEVHDADEFERYDLATLRGKVDKIDLESVSNLVTAWNTIADRHKTSLDTFTQAMAKATDDSVWAGQARDGAAGAVRDYATQGAQVTNAARLTGSKLAELQTGLDPTKQLVPHVPEHRSGVDNLRSVLAGRDWRNDDVAEYNSKTEALRVLRTVYAPVVHDADTNVPVIPRPAQNTAKPGDDGGGKNGPDGGGAVSGPTAGIEEYPSDGKAPGAEVPGGSETTDEPTTTSSTDPASTSATTPQSTDSGSGTTAASTTPATAGATGGSGTGSHTGSGSGSGSGGSGSATPGPGRSVSGTPNAAAATQAATGTAATSAARGANGMGGMGSGARGGKSDEESGKDIPDYLITQENGAELTGLDALPKMVPPVIGE